VCSSSSDVSQGTSSTTTAPASTASLTLTKSCPGCSYENAGDTLNYQYLVQNTGEAGLTNIAVTDSPVTCPEQTLTPSDQEPCTANYTLSQTDVDNENL